MSDSPISEPSNVKHSATDKAKRGVLWVSIDRFGQQAIQVVVVVVMARWLEPEEFGLVAMITILMSVSQSLVDSGMAQALIRKNVITVEERSTVFWFNLMVSLALFGLIIGTAPWVADFYEEPILVDLIRGMAFVIPFLAVGLIHRADLIQRMAFKEEALTQIPATLIAGMIAITLSVLDFGVWALVAQQMSLAFLGSLFLWLRVRSEIRLTWSSTAFKECFGFGYKLMVSGLIESVFRDINKLVLGKAFGAATLGFYAQARKLQDLSTKNLISIIQKVTYPLLSRSEAHGNLKESYRKVVMVSSLAILPLSLFLIIAAQPIVHVVLGSKWAASALILQITGISGLFYHLHAINLNVLKVLGRSDLFLKLEVLKKTNIVIALVIGVPLGFEPLLWMLVGASFVALYINTWYTKRLIGYGLIEQMKDVGQIFLLCVPMVLAVGLLILTDPEYSLWLLLSLTLGAAVLYLVSVRFIRNAASDLAYELMNPILKRVHLIPLSRTP